MRGWKVVAETDSPTTSSDDRHLETLMALLQQGEEAAVRKLLTTWSPQNWSGSQAWNALAVYLAQQNRLPEARQAAQTAKLLDPNNAEAWNNSACLYLQEGLFKDALSDVDQALHLDPKRDRFYLNRARALEGMHRLGDALESYQQLINLNPDHALAYANMGLIELDRKHWTRALSCLERAYDLDPDIPYIPSGIFLARLQLGDWSHYETLRQDLIKGIEHDRPVCEPFTGLSVTDEPWLQRRCAQWHARERFPAVVVSKRTTRRPGRIRLAYWSADVRTHAVGFLTAGLFAEHDRSCFEVFVYVLKIVPDDPVQERIRCSVEHFVDLSTLADWEIVARARQDDLDILVDLQGFTAGYRSLPLAHRLAPVQINYLGFPATMGTAVHDYILADKVMVPEEVLPQISEQPIWMPVCFQVSDDQRPIPQPLDRSDYGLPEQAFVFACLYSFYKINPVLMDDWLHILLQVEQSVLWLVTDSAEAQQSVRDYVAKRGLQPERLIFCASAPYPEQLARLQQADLVLDTRPYGGGTSTNDALWMGVPVLTLCGQAPVNRMSASLLKTLGLDELVCSSPEEYKAQAVRLAQKPQMLKALRMQIRDGLRRQKLFATKQRCRELEQAYRMIHERDEAGLPPVALHVQPVVPDDAVMAWPVRERDKMVMQDWLKEADHALNQGDAASAARSLANIAEQCPELPGIRSDWILSLLAEHDLDTASAVLKGMERFGVRAAAAFEAVGTAFAQSQQLDRALPLLQTAAVLDVNKASVWNALAYVQLESGQLNEAALAMNRAVATEPDEVSWKVNQVAMFIRSGQLSLAITGATAIVQRDAEHFQAWYLLASAQLLNRSWQPALDACAHCLSIKPDDLNALKLQTQILRGVGQPEAALHLVKRCLQNHEQDGWLWLEAHYLNLDLKQRQEAEHCLYKALEINPQEPLLLGRIIHWRLAGAQWQCFQQDGQHAIHLMSQGVRCLQPLDALMIPIGPEWTLKAAEFYARHEVRAQRRQRKTRRPGRIRVVYVSSDFGPHAVSVLVAGLFAHHDRQQFEVTVLALRVFPDDPTFQRICSGAEHCVDASLLSLEDIIQISIEADWDLAIDLNGPTDGHRMALWGMGLAPVQMQYLGFPGSTGSPVHDYIIADSVLIPESMFSFYREQVIWLETGFQINDDQRVAPLLRNKADLGFAEHQRVLACFNGIHKINPVMFGLWMQIMQQVPQSVLWLVVECPQTRQQLQDACRAHQVDPARLYFSERVSYLEYLGRIHAADLILDTLPFSGGTTSSDVLWVGAPILTCPGDTFAGRMTASLLTFSGWHELIASSLIDYVDKAVYFLNNPDQLGRIRSQIRDGDGRRRLFDTAAKVRLLERAYQQVHQNAERGKVPRHVSVS